MVFVLYILLALVFLLGGLSHKFKYMDIFVFLAMVLFFLLMPLAFYNLNYIYNGTPSSPTYLEELVIGRTFAILKHFGDPVRTLVIIQPLAYMTGKMCFEIHKILKG